MREVPNQRIDLAAISKDVAEQEAHHISMLREGLKASFTGVMGFQNWICQEMKRIGMEVTEYAVDDTELRNQPSMHKMLCENPAALNRGPNMVGKLPGKGTGHGVLLFGHADKPPITYEWGKKNPDLIEKGSRLEGAGIADDVAGLTSMLSAVETFLRLGMKLQGDLLVASVLGKQLGVVGTYGLTSRFGPMHAAIYVHPAESGNGLGDLKVASLGMADFILTIDGKRPDTTEPNQTIYSRSAVNAIEKGMHMVQAIAQWATELNQLPEYGHPELEKLAQQSFAVSIGRFLSGADNLVYEIPTRCVIQGAINFPPSIRLEDVQKDFETLVDQLVHADPWLGKGHMQLEWGDFISESCQSDANSELIQIAKKAITDVTGKIPRLNYGHTTSDLRYPLLWWHAQSVGMGPLAGDMHTEHEYVDRKEYLDTIVTVAELLRNAA